MYWFNLFVNLYFKCIPYLSYHILIVGSIIISNSVKLFLCAIWRSVFHFYLPKTVNTETYVKETGAVNHVDWKQIKVKETLTIEYS